MRPAIVRRHTCQLSASRRARAWRAAWPTVAPAEASRDKSSIGLSRAPATPERHWGQCPGCIFAGTLPPSSLASLGMPRHAVALIRCSPCACPAASLLFEAFLDLAVASNAPAFPRCSKLWQPRLSRGRNILGQRRATQLRSGTQSGPFHADKASNWVNSPSPQSAARKDRQCAGPNPNQNGRPEPAACRHGF